MAAPSASSTAGESQYAVLITQRLFRPIRLRSHSLWPLQRLGRAPRPAAGTCSTRYRTLPYSPSSTATCTGSRLTHWKRPPHPEHPKIDSRTWERPCWTSSDQRNLHLEHELPAPSCDLPRARNLLLNCLLPRSLLWVSLTNALGV